MTHAPTKRGAPRAAFAASASPSPSHGDGGVPSRTTSCAPDSKDLRAGGRFLLCGGLGGATAGGLGFSAGAGFAGEALRGLAGVEGFIPQLDIRMSSSEHPSHQNSPRAAHQGMLAAHVSVRRRSAPTPAARTRWHTPAGG